MYLKRKIDKFLEEWKRTPDKLPIIVKGARQVGKTESILHFSKQYEYTVVINFVEEPKYRTITEGGYDVNTIIKNITRIDPSKQFVPGKTLLVFDELQAFPAIATALKFFKTDGRFDVICSGSLLGINYQEIESNSVGYKTDYLMSSLDFEEYLWAKGYKDDTVNDMLSHMRSLQPFNKTEMDTYHALFLEYSILGGMPAVINNSIRKNSFEGSLSIQKQLTDDYREDIRKYVTGMDQTRILNVYNHVVPQLAKDNKKFQITKVAPRAKMSDYVGCIEWLCDSGIINVCYCMNYPELPIKGNVDTSRFKLYYADTGLLISELDDETQEDLRTNKNLGIYKGAIYENMVAEALKKQGYSLCYYKREDSTLEEDFFIRNTDSLIPVEVKATNNTSKSLAELIDNPKYGDIHFGIKLAKANIGFNGKVFTFPYFTAFLLKRYLSE